jgi:ketosteroid isomerase-like protein
MTTPAEATSGHVVTCDSDAPLSVVTGVGACDDALVADPASVVRRYFEIVADLDSSVDALLAVLHPSVRVIEHPNMITPRGAVRDRDAVVAGFLAGKGLLEAQTIDVHEVLVSGDRVAVRATWRGTLSQATRSVSASTELVAKIAGMLTVEDGSIREHETFDCYEPLTVDQDAAVAPRPGG